jgi:hypothetical protein
MGPEMNRCVVMVIGGEQGIGGLAELSKIYETGPTALAESTRTEISVTGDRKTRHG